MTWSWDRVVKVGNQAGDRIFGTGALIAAGRVLTARHVVFTKDGQARPDLAVCLAGAKKFEPVTIAWSGEGGLDVAVLAAPGLRSPDRAPLSPREFDAQAWETKGYPIVDTQEPNRALKSVGGTARSYSALSSDLELDVDGLPDVSGGLSGAPILLAGSIVGVMRALPAGWDRKRLLATPVARFLGLLGFRKALGLDDHAPTSEYWSDSQVEARLAAILSGATALAESLDSRLEKHSSKNHNPLPQPERAARRIMDLGKGLKAAHTLTEACYDATLAKDADAAGDRPAVRDLLSEWFPYGYRDAARVVVLRLTDGTADPRNLRASSHREHFVEIYMASDDGRACNFTSTQIDGLGRSVAESMFPAPPGSSQRMSGDAIAQKLVDALSSRFEVRSVGDLKAEFKDQATKHKMTPYLLVRVPIGQNGLSDATFRRLHELLPSLRVVALPDASDSHELEDELWRWMIKLFAN